MTRPVPDLVVVEERSDSPAAGRLLAAFVAEIQANYPAFDPDVGPSARPEDFEAPHGAFFVAYGDGRPIGCCGVKSLDDATVEVKRLWVSPEGRGLGTGRRLLEACHHWARTAGAERVRLDTGSKQVAALGLFIRAGYVAIDDYNGNPFAQHWFELSLSGAQGPT